MHALSTILLASAETSIPGAWLSGAVIAVLALAYAIGVFTPGQIPRPQRLAAGESPAVLASVMGFALLAWVFANLMLGLWLRATSLPNAKIPDKQLLAANILILAWVLAVILIATASLRRRGMRLLGFTARLLPRGVFLGVVGIILVLPLVLYAETFSDWLWRELHRAHSPAHDLLLMLKNNPQPGFRAAVVLSAVVLAPITEELFFRGHLQTYLRYFTKRPWVAIVLTSALFALAHDWWTQPTIFILGLALGYAYERTQNLWTNITLHALFNLTSVVIYWHFFVH